MLAVAAALVFGFSLWRTVSAVLESEGSVPLDGAVHQVDLPAGEHTLFVPENSDATCDITDAAGEPIAQRNPLGSINRSKGSDTWVAAKLFTTDAETVSVRCQGDVRDVPVEIGPEIQIGSFVGGIALTVIAPLLLGFAAIIWLVVLIILMARGAPRR